jgi:hypothetical protein
MQEPNTISPADAKLAVEILKKALEYRPLPPAIVGQAFSSLTHEERLTESMTPRMALSYADEGKALPTLYFRFVGDAASIVEAIFYPYQAILTFLAEARDFGTIIYPLGSDETKRAQFVFDRSVEMTLIMLDHFYQRAELMMESFTWEVITQWQLQNTQRVIHYQAELGEVVPKKKDKSLENALTHYTEQILNLWKWQGQTVETNRKLRLAEDYEAIYMHWKRLLGMVGHEDWLEYTKPKKFADTPDDLLAKLPDIDRRDEETTKSRLSGFAVEHAARRAGLIKKHGVDPSILKKRRNGIKATGYSASHLFQYLKEGRELLIKWKEREAFMTQAREGIALEQAVNSAPMEKANSLEQNIQFSQTENRSPGEQIPDSAQIEDLSN